jgi:hypothetical protein
VLLSVHTADGASSTRAKVVLKQTGAEDISSSGEATGDVHAAALPGALGCNTNGSSDGAPVIRTADSNHQEDRHADSRNHAPDFPNDR